MLRLKHLNITRNAVTLSSRLFFPNEDKLFPIIPSQHPSKCSSNRFLDFYQLGNKAAMEKERARLSDELNRGYFADISEFNQHGGKIAMANKVIIPGMTAVKFPALEVNNSDGTSLKLPIVFNGNGADVDKSNVPKASLMCLSFRASSQVCITSMLFFS
ncbi:hypothetical protein RJ639_037541 [Escallonia herrerae]|uniref:Uncharacterized protein n=1 Tax=Escallonia herrerae TaxID=1293975 RepID=A0AA88WNC6_9ASTE|nr:hypothetical protein RJ639_037541 [Escallonia herrerae]